MVRVSSPAKLRPWSELIAKMVMGVVPELVSLLIDIQKELHNFAVLGGGGGGKGHQSCEKYFVNKLAFPKDQKYPSTAGNSMTVSERPSPEPLLKKRGVCSRTGGREFWKCSGAFECHEL